MKHTPMCNSMQTRMQTASRGYYGCKQWQTQAQILTSSECDKTRALPLQSLEKFNHEGLTKTIPNSGTGRSRPAVSMRASPVDTTIPIQLKTDKRRSYNSNQIVVSLVFKKLTNCRIARRVSAKLGPRLFSCLIVQWFVIF